MTTDASSDIRRAPDPAAGAGDDHRLIQRMAGADQGALRTLMGRHQVRVYRFIARLTRNEAVSEELTNEVFMEAWRNAARFEGRANAATWLLSIAHNKAVSSLRKRREEALDEAAAEAIPDGGDDPEVAAQKADKGAVMRRCMGGLTAEHREIVDLVYYQEMSIAEVSEILSIPEATVKTRMFYARRKLSELLKAGGVDRGWP